MLLAIVHILGGDAADQGVSWIAVGEQRTDRKQDFGDCQRRTPVVFQDV